MKSLDVLAMVCANLLWTEKSLKNRPPNPRPRRIRDQYSGSGGGGGGSTGLTSSLQPHPWGLYCDVDHDRHPPKKKRKAAASVSRFRQTLPSVAPPLVIKKAIAEMDGYGAALVIEKALCETDLSKGHNRLSVPASKVVCGAEGFLTARETTALETRDRKHTVGIEAALVEPDGCQRGTITLKKWNMNNTATYVLNRTWSAVVQRHRLRRDDVIQLWSFRVDSALCFALTVL